jgi:small multidrug resistance family-3 protein
MNDRESAAHGGVYVMSALLWLWLIEGERPNRWDVVGVRVCLLGTAIIVVAPRTY